MGVFFDIWLLLFISNDRRNFEFEFNGKGKNDLKSRDSRGATNKNILESRNLDSAKIKHGLDEQRSKFVDTLRFGHVLSSSVFFQDKEIHILLDDQQKINKFARLNNRLEELKDDLKNRKNETQTLEDAATDLMMLEDDEEKVPYQVGEVFVFLAQDEVQDELEKRKSRLADEMSEIEAKIDGLKSQMSDLKTHLYAKFGSAINLEADEE